MIEIEKLEAGPEVDALVAEKVMGWKRNDENHNWLDASGAGVAYQNDDYWGEDGPKQFCPSTDMADAYEILRLLRRSFGRVELVGVDTPADHFWECLVAGGTARAGTAAMAICRAALKAKDSEVQKP